MRPVRRSRRSCAFGTEAEFINADVRKENDVRALVDKTSRGSAVSMSR